MRRKSRLFQRHSYSLNVVNEFLLANFVVGEDCPELFVVFVLPDIFLGERRAAGNSVFSVGVHKAQVGERIFDLPDCLFVQHDHKVKPDVVGIRRKFHVYIFMQYILMKGFGRVQHARTPQEKDMPVGTMHLVVVNPLLIGADFIPAVRDFVDKMAADIAGVFSVRVVEPLKPCPFIKQIVIGRNYAGFWKTFQCRKQLFIRPGVLAEKEFHAVFFKRFYLIVQELLISKRNVHDDFFRQHRLRHERIQSVLQLRNALAVTGERDNHVLRRFLCPPDIPLFKGAVYLLQICLPPPEKEKQFAEQSVIKHKCTNNIFHILLLFNKYSQNHRNSVHTSAWK